MNDKKEIVERVLSLLKENNLTQIFLDNSVSTSWPGQNEKPYHIIELNLNDEDRIEAWQGPGFKFQTLVNYLDDFDLWTISRVEKELHDTISHLKKYRVQVISYVDVKASSPEKAADLVSSPRYKTKEHLLWFDVGNKTKEID